MVKPPRDLSRGARWKVLLKITSHRLSSYCKKKGVLHDDEQCGFRSKRSTVDIHDDVRRSTTTGTRPKKGDSTMYTCRVFHQPHESVWFRRSFPPVGQSEAMWRPAYCALGHLSASFITIKCINFRISRPEVSFRGDLPSKAESSDLCIQHFLCGISAAPRWLSSIKIVIANSYYYYYCWHTDSDGDPDLGIHLLGNRGSCFLDFRKFVQRNCAQLKTEIEMEITRCKRVGR